MEPNQVLASEPATQATPDIFTRVASAPQVQTPVVQDIPDAVTYDLAEIKDPIARAVAEKKIKDLESGYNRKYMDLAEKRKDMDKKLEALNRPKIWTAEEVTRLTQDPTFVQAATAAAASQPPSNYSGSQADWSALNDQEKSRMLRMEQELQANRSTLTTMRLQQIDNALKGKYSDYDPTQIESFQREIAEGRVTDDRVRELIHLALNAPKYIDRSYKFGLEDRKGNIQEKINSSSTTGVNVATQEAATIRKDGESSRQHFTRIALEKLAQLRK